MEGLVGRMLHKSLAELREIPRAEYLFWIEIIKQYGDGSGVMFK